MFNTATAILEKLYILYNSTYFSALIIFWPTVNIGKIKMSLVSEHGIGQTKEIT